jgi:hypothetical protein
MSAREAVQKTQNKIHAVQQRIKNYREFVTEPTEFQNFLLQLIEDTCKSVNELALAVEQMPGYKEIP